MNPMKSTTLATLILVFAIAGMGTLAYSQEKLNEFMTETTPEERAQMQTDYMKETLSLKEDQEAKVHGVNVKYAEKMQEAYEAPTKKQQKAQTMKRINSEKEAELKLLLSADQYATYEKNKEAMKEKITARIKEKGK
jgi:murein L,D-transpeptidase YcbB/YkuD